MARRLHRELSEVRAAVVRDGAATAAGWADRILRREYQPSAENLAHYLALRAYDLRQIQLELMPLGLSSLGRCEARVLPNLDAVLAALGAIARLGADGAVFDEAAFFRGHELLHAETEAVFGDTPARRGVRIMVTLPSEAADDPAIVRTLVAAGMDAARINCAHDGAEAWTAMTAHVREAARELDRTCRVCFDLTGPRARVASTTIDERARLRRGERVLMTSARVPVASPWTRQFECSLPEIVDGLVDGAEIRVNEGRLGAVVERRLDEGLLLRVDAARDQGEHLRVEKGLNFPGSDLQLGALTPKDLADLDTIAANADLVGLSFVQCPSDVAAVQAALADRGGSGLGLVLKIETELAVRNLPELIIEGAGRQPLAVMIARGDLAVEIGDRRLAEMQEELLWLCEAAHVPVIWATQVLDNFVKKGTRHRGELTDAAMAERAECVMLNKGPFAAEAVALLAQLLERMEGHQFKKISRMRALHTWTNAS